MSKAKQLKEDLLNKGQLSPSEEKVVEDKLTRSRIQMLMHFPFFGILALNLQLKQEYGIPTAGTDGEVFVYNPNFIKSLPEGQINWVVVHEVMHPALQHIWRRGDRNKTVWNYACDYAIHDIMMQFKENAKREVSNLLEKPDWVLYDPKYKDMTADEIYDILMKEQQKQQQKQKGNGGQGGGNDNGFGDGQGTLDDHDMWDNSQTQQNGQAKAQDWEGKMVSAAQSAEGKSQGNVPAFLKRLIGNITKPQKNWRSLLAEFVQPEIDDYSFNPPDKRYTDYDFFLPDFNDEVEVVKKILFWVDTSGSIGDKELSVAYSEIVGAINQFQGKLSGYIGFFDHKAYPVTPFENIKDVLEIKPVGGGGTSFHAPFEYVKENFKNDDDIAGIIMLTDGYATWPKESIANGIPTLWLITNSQQVPPWGLHTTLKI